MRLLTPLLMLLMVACSLQAQISIPDEIPEHDPIVAGCECIIPDNSDVRFVWTVDSTSKYYETTSPSPRLFIWAPPGQHFVKLLVVIQKWEEQLVLVPGPNFNTDKTDLVQKTIRVSTGLDTQNYEKYYKVLGDKPVPPGPEPDPDNPDPEPVNPTGLEKVKAAAPDKSKLDALAGNYLSVGSQMGDPARNGAMNMQVCTQMVQGMNRDVLEADFSQWSGFFKELAEWQIDYIDKNKVDISSSPSSEGKRKVSEMFTAIGEGLK